MGIIADAFKLMFGGKEVGVQNPLPTDGDSVYVKDIWVSQSIVADWQDLDNVGGDLIKIPFSNLHTAINNQTLDNVKRLRVHFNRTISLFQVGIGCAAHSGKNFSNVKVKALGSGGIERTVEDDSNNNAKYTSRNYQFESTLANAIELEFHTIDEITLSNITIHKVSQTSAILKAKKPDGTVRDINATAGGNLKVSLEEIDPDAKMATIQNLDAFERLRISETGQRVDIEFKYDLQPEIMQVSEILGASIIHNLLEKDVSLKVNNINLSEAEYVQKWDNPYTSGNSQLIFITGTADKSEINTLSASVYLRDAIRGIIVEIPQAEWLIDTSGQDWSKSHIFVMDFQSLKVGSARFGLDINGKFTQIAQINNDNIRAHGYWQDPNQPLSWKIYNTSTETITEIGYDDGVNGIGFRFKQPINASAECVAICGTVKSEGGGNLFDISGLPNGCSRGTSSIVVGATPLPIISIRAKYLFKNSINKTIILPKTVNIQSDNSIHFYLVVNGILTNEIWQNVDSDSSAVEFDIAASAITGGKIIHPNYLATGARNTTAGEGSLLGKSVLTGARGNSDTLTLVAVRTSGLSAEVYGAFEFEEIR